MGLLISTEVKWSKVSAGLHFDCKTVADMDGLVGILKCMFSNLKAYCAQLHREYSRVLS